jgi:epoxyqueuosine reductase
MSLTEQVRRKARDLGFELVGVTPAAPLKGAEFYARWVGLGFAGQMRYLARNQEKRADPAALVPGARSVICLGMGYYQEAPLCGDPGRGRISCYARGSDYHELIKERLRFLWNFIRERAGGNVDGRYYVDTGPVLERELAHRAGLGWWGKNTCLINKGRGSFFFLAEIILDLELDYDRPAADHCGTCTRCLDACPTGAFPEPYVLDARRCIAYLTIELKGPIPRDLRPRMGNWVFGCDICQNVCPWNRRAETATEASFQSRPGLTHPDLLGLLSLDRGAFNERFRRNPARRTRRQGVLRNAAVALGNSGDRKAVPALARALGDEESLIRGHAAWALGRIGGEQARRALERALTSEGNPAVAGEIRQALDEMQG